MGYYKYQLIETIVGIVILFFTFQILIQFIDRIGLKLQYQKSRIKIIKKAVSFILYSLFFVVFILIWGIAPSQLVGFLSSLFAVIGIAFIAQWSIISNITSSLIIFFNHQVKIGDRIAVLDKEYQIEGKISDIGIFFIIIKTLDGEYVSLPSNIFMLKMIKKLKDQETIDEPA